LSQGQTRALVPVQALWILCLPLFDTVRLLVWCTALGVSPFRADQEHLHHMFQRRGFGHASSAAIILALHTMSATLGLVGPALGLSEFSLFALFMLLFLVYVLWLGYPWRQQRWLGGALSASDRDPLAPRA